MVASVQKSLSLAVSRIVVYKRGLRRLGDPGADDLVELPANVLELIQRNTDLPAEIITDVDGVAVYRNLRTRGTPPATAHLPLH